jgi:hypothetical protein
MNVERRSMSIDVGNRSIRPPANSITMVWP